MRRVPWWAWLLLVTATLYLAYNPTGVSVWHLWTAESGLALPLRLLLTLALAAMIGLWCLATWRSLGPVGVAVLAALLGLGVWLAVDLGADPRAGLTPHLLPQALLAVVLTAGLRGASVWRRLTGRVSVDDGHAETHH